MAKSKNMVQIEKTAELVSGVVVNHQLKPLLIEEGKKQYERLYQDVADAILLNLRSVANLRTLGNDINAWEKEYERIIKQKPVDNDAAKNLYQSWSKINDAIMHNGEIEIIASISDADGPAGSRIGAYSSDEGQHLSSKSYKNKTKTKTKTDNYALTTGISADMFAGLKKDNSINNISSDQSLEYFDFGKHYNALHKTLTKYQPNLDEYKAARYEATQSERGTKKSKKDRKKRYWDGRHNRQPYVFTQLVYGENNIGTIGRIVEVFFNHLAQYHHRHIQIENGHLKIDNIHGSVRDEEAPELLANMYRWNDNDPLTAGGDIIIIDKSDDKEKIQYNIQLKSTDKIFDNLNEIVGNCVNITTIHRQYMRYAAKMFEEIMNEKNKNITDQQKLLEKIQIPEKFIKNLITSVWKVAGEQASDQVANVTNNMLSQKK